MNRYSNPGIKDSAIFGIENYIETKIIRTNWDQGWVKLPKHVFSHTLLFKGFEKIE